MQRLAYGKALLAAGRVKEARAQFERLRDAGLDTRELGLVAAQAAAADSDAASAVAWLQSIPRSLRPENLAREPAFRSIAGRPEFRALFD